MNMRFILLTVFAAVATALPATPGTDIATLAERADLTSTAPLIAVAEPAHILQRAPAENSTLGAVEIADPYPAPFEIEGNFEVQYKTTAKGKKYRAFRPKGSHAAEQLAKREDAKRKLAKRDGVQQLDPRWTAGGSGSVSSSSLLNSVAGLELWKLDIGGLIYWYRISFVTHYTKTYGFTDDTFDTYFVTCYVKGSHHIDYNSDFPDIGRVEWHGY